MHHHGSAPTKVPFWKGFLVLLLGLWIAQATAAEGQKKKGKKKPPKKETSEEILEGITNSFALPLKDLYKKEFPNEWRNLLSEFSGGFSVGYPLLERTLDSGLGASVEGERVANATAAASLKWNPVSFWFASISFIHYLEPELQRPWNGDFVYVMGYSDWRPYAFSLTYANYGGNRLDPDRERGETYSEVERGGITLSWNYVLPDWFKRLFTVHSTGGLGGSVAITTVPRSFDLATGEDFHWKTTLRVNVKYTIYKWWYVNFSLIHYLDPATQQPWDPDFTWGFGYFDWHPGTITIQYNNFSGNRFPWNEKSPGTGRFKDGGISIAWSWTL